MYLIGFSTNYINIPIYTNYKVLQVTLGSPNESKYEDFYKFKIDRKNTKIFIHSKYTYNISKNNINYPIKTEVEFLKFINEENSGIVIHLSKYYTKNRHDALLDVANKLNELTQKYLINTTYSILLETSHIYEHLGSRIDDFYVIYNNLTDLAKKHVGICLDTSHLFLAGLDISNINILLEYMALFEQKIGFNYIKLIHLNDIDSEVFGKHTPHLSVNDEKGKIFYNNYLNLDVFLILAKKYIIPIILERNTLQYINKEINFIKNHNLNISERVFFIIIKNIIVINFINLLIDYYTFINNNYLNSLKKFKKFIIELYNESNHNYFKSKHIYKSYETVLQFLYDRKEEFKFIIFDIKEIYYNYSYDIFLKYINNCDYISMKNLYDVMFLGVETVKKLFYEHSISSIADLQKLPISKKKKILTIPQYKALQCYKFIKQNIPLNIILNICKLILSFSFNLNIYGSIYRFLHNKTQDQNATFKDIDLLLVIEHEKDIDNFFKKMDNTFLLKGILIDGEKRKSMVYKYVDNKKNYFFILDFYSCVPDEFVFMSVYLKGPTESNIILRKIAKSKGYVLSNTSLKDLEGNKYFFNTEEELFKFFNYKK